MHFFSHFNYCFKRFANINIFVIEEKANEIFKWTGRVHDNRLFSFFGIAAGDRQATNNHREACSHADPAAGISSVTKKL
jgi:hypothetical protein